MAWISLTIAGVIFFLGFATLSKRKKAERNNIIAEQKNVDKSVIGLKKRGFVTTESFKTGTNILAWDKGNQKVAFVTFTSQKYRADVFDYKSIRHAEIIKDGETIFKKSTIRTVGGAIVGGTLLGGIGAIVGGLSGSSVGKEKINNLYLKIYFNSIDNPSRIIEFINETTLNNDRKKLINEAEKWKDRLSAIIDSEKFHENESTQTKELASIADEIKKYKELLDIGAITETEYNLQKNKLIN